MTNLEKIRSMNDEELIRFLAEYIDPSDLNYGYCNERCPHADECDECSQMNCMVTDEMIIKEWAESEYKGR